MDNKEKCCGCVIIDNEKVLLIQQNEGHWGFPKGHVEFGESEVETAIREVKEETNIDVIPDESKRYIQEYVMSNGKEKQVVFFVAKKVSNDIKAQECEIKNIKWFSFKDALMTITFDNTKQLFKKILMDCGYKV